VAPCPLDGVFGSDMIDVAFGVIPVDVNEGKALRVAENGLRQRLAQAQQIVNLLVGPHQPIERKFLQRQDGCLNVPSENSYSCPLKRILLRRRSCCSRIPSRSTDDRRPPRRARASSESGIASPG